MPRPALSGLAAIAGVIAASTCCLPVLPFVAAAGLAGGSTFLWAARPYLIGASIALVLFGFFQAARAKKCNGRPGLFSYLLLWLSAAAVAIGIFFPQLASAVIHVRPPAGQPPLASITNVAHLRAAFNAASSETRVVVFLSPT